MAVAVVAASCSSARGSSGPVPRTDSHGTVWLCRPGIADDPCTGDLRATAVSSTGAHSPVPAAGARRSRFDCFYVYPTVSGERGPNADLTVQPTEIGAARLQASRFSQVCDVWAPMYRQVTLSALLTGGVAALDTAYGSLLAAWNDYLHHFNDGRPVIFIGHSQGAAMLIRLLANEVDPVRSLRSRMVVAILAGGNVQVATGRLTGGSFKNLPLCTSPREDGCVIGFSTFPSQPPAGALFGRPGQGVSLQALQIVKQGQQVACVNPAAIGGGTGGLEPYYPSPGGQGVATPWVTYPGLYTASCHSAGGATWLQVDHLAVPGDTRPAVTEPLGPLWGYHVDDVQLTLGNLVDDVRSEEAGYRR